MAYEDIYQEEREFPMIRQMLIKGTGLPAFDIYLPRADCTIIWDSMTGEVRTIWKGDRAA